MLPGFHRFGRLRCVGCAAGGWFAIWFGGRVGDVDRPAGRAVAGEHVVEDVFTVRFDRVHEGLEEVALLVGEAVGLGGHPGGREARELDEFADPALVDRLDGVLGGLDVVGQPADFGGVERVVRRRGGALALGSELGDERADVGVEVVVEMLEAIALAFLAPCRLEVSEIHTMLPRPSRRGRVPSGTRPRIHELDVCPPGV